MAKKVNKRFLVVLTIVVVAGGVMAMAAKIILPKFFKKNPEVLLAQSDAFEKQGKIEEAISAYQLAVVAGFSGPLFDRVTVRKVCASIERVMCRYQPEYCRTW